jgi:myo-inositol-1(or 4)-monophosphatase
MPGSDRLPLVAGDWLDACRRMVAAQRELFERISGIEARTEYEGVGEGGDRSLVIDRRAEDLVFDELERLHEAGASFTAISEERGEVVFGDGSSATRVVIDPIDGSLNARRMLPSFALSIAIASGESMADVELAFVHDFGAGDEFVADHGAGAALNGAALLARGPGYGLELVGLEGAKPERLLPLIEGLAGNAFRCRGIGSLAITLCYVAAARLDGMLSGRPARSVDVAAAQLIVREAGAVVAFPGFDDPLGAPLDIEPHARVVAARTPASLARLIAALA